MSIEHDTMLLAALRCVKTKQVSGDLARKSRYYGLCSVTTAELFGQYGYRGYDARPSLDKLCIKWPLFSGNRCYPVPAFNEHNGHRYKTAGYAHSKYVDCDNKWDTSTHYGAARVALLDWLIATLEARVQA